LYRNSSSLLCSECETGRTKALGSAVCVLDAECTAAVWLLPLGLLLLLLAAWYLTTTWNDPRSALIRACFYYFQTFGLVTPSFTDNDTQRSVLNIFNMRASGAGIG
jgi:hypothetical protein